MALDLNRLQNGVESSQVQIAKLREENASLRDVFNEIRELLQPTNFEARLKKKLDASHWTAEAEKPISPKKNNVSGNTNFGVLPTSDSLTLSISTFDGNATEPPFSHRDDNATARGEVSKTGNAEDKEKSKGKPKKEPKKEKKKQKGVVNNNMSLSERIFHDRIELMRSGNRGDPMSQQLGQLEERLSTIASALRNSPNLDDAMKVQRPPEVLAKEKAERRKKEREEDGYSDDEEDADSSDKSEYADANSGLELCWECNQMKIKGCQDYDDGHWYCEDCWKECRADSWNAATRLSAAARGRRDRKMVEAKKNARKKLEVDKNAQTPDTKRRQSGSWTQWPRKSLDKVPAGQMCFVCEKVKISGSKRNSIGGKWTCDECHEPVCDAFAYEETFRRCCEDCGDYKSDGKYDETNIMAPWYCLDCWAKFPANSETADTTPKKIEPAADSLQLCGDCGQRKAEGKVDPSEGKWFCSDCWKAFGTTSTFGPDISTASATSAVVDPEITEGEPQVCGDCGNTQTRGKVDPETGDWFCELCWAKVDEEGEAEEDAAGEGEEEEVADGEPRLCGDCGEMKTKGEKDPDSDDWFCSDCWAAVEAAEAEGGEV